MNFKMLLILVLTYCHIVIAAPERERLPETYERARSHMQERVGTVRAHQQVTELIAKLLEGPNWRNDPQKVRINEFLGQKISIRSLRDPRQTRTSEQANFIEALLLVDSVEVLPAEALSDVLSINEIIAARKKAFLNYLVFETNTHSANDVQFSIQDMVIFLRTGNIRNLTTLAYVFSEFNLGRAGSNQLNQMIDLLSQGLRDSLLREENPILIMGEKELAAYKKNVEISSIDQQIEDIDRQLRTGHLNEIQKENLRAERDQLRERLDQINSLFSMVDEFTAEVGELSHEGLLRKIERLRSDISRLEQLAPNARSQSNVQQELKKLKEELEYNLEIIDNDIENFLFDGSDSSIEGFEE